MNKSKLSKIYPHLIALVIFMILNSIYFYPQLQGKKVVAGDTVSWTGMSKELLDVRKETGENVMWTNAMFGGMPAFAISTPRNSNKAGMVESVFQLFQSRPIGFFNALMIGFYIMLVLLGVNPYLSIIGSLAFAFTTNHFILFEAGHMTKIRAIAFLPMVVAGLVLTFRKNYLLGGLIFALGLAINIHANHPQMTYYLGLVLLIYVVIEAVHYLRNRQFKELGIAGGILSAGLILAIACSGGLLLGTYDHSKQTMRGKPILEKPEDAPASSSSQVEGLEWTYAMNWSNAGKDLLTAVVPGAVGGSSARKISQNSQFAKELRKVGSRADLAPLYWGGLPSTSGPIYYGSIVVFLFLMSLFVVKNRFKWWVVSAIVLTIMISMGSNLEWFNRPLFDHLPLFNKFRAHSSVLAVTGLLIPLLAFLGLHKLLEDTDRKEAIKWLTYSSGGLLALLLIIALIGPMVFDFSGSRDGLYQQQAGWIDALVIDRKALMRNDALRSFGFVAVSAALLWLYLKDKLSKIVVIVGLGVLIVMDLWGVGKRYLDNSSFVLQRTYTNQYSPRPVDNQIFANEPRGRGYYRVLDMSHDTYQSSKASYYHNTIGGYHPAKLQRYQDIIDYHLSQGNIGALNMLNTKYIITQDAQLQVNEAALGPVWFVESVEQVNTPNEEIEVLSSLDPYNVAIVLQSEFDDYIDSFDPDRKGSIELSDYKPHHLKYTSNSSSDQFAVFSEIWYGPNKGWQAYIDGNPVDHIRVNYVLRGMKIPAGQHEIEFIFNSRIYNLGNKISLVSSLLLLGFVGVYFGRKGFDFYKEQEDKVEIKRTRKVVKKKKIKRVQRRKK